MKSRKHYEKLFDPYPDVVTLPEFCNMLGGIGAVSYTHLTLPTIA